MATVCDSTPRPRRNATGAQRRESREAPPGATWDCDLAVRGRHAINYASHGPSDAYAVAICGKRANRSAAEGIPRSATGAPWDYFWFA